MGLMVFYPTANLLLTYALNVYLKKAGNYWTLEGVGVAIEKSPHVSTLDTKAMCQL